MKIDMKNMNPLSTPSRIARQRDPGSVVGKPFTTGSVTFTGRQQIKGHIDNHVFLTANHASFVVV